jgi:hypothetical protein
VSLSNLNIVGAHNIITEFASLFYSLLDSLFYNTPPADTSGAKTCENYCEIKATKAFLVYVES